MRILLFLIVIISYSCKDGYHHTKKQNYSQRLKKSKSVSDYKKSDFLISMNQPFVHTDFNYIYSPTILYAWSKVKEIYKPPFISKPTNILFSYLNDTKHFYSLDKSEYKSEISTNKSINIKVAFKNEFSYFLEFDTISTFKFKSQSIKLLVRRVI